jgi:Rab GTPase-activating protein 1
MMVACVKTSRRDLLALDFEGVLKYFRVQLPKKYKSEEAARDLLNMAVSMKVCFLIITVFAVLC